MKEEQKFQNETSKKAEKTFEEMIAEKILKFDRPYE